MKKRSMLRIMGYSSLACSGMLALAFLFPIVGSNASAEGEALTSRNSLKAATYVYSTLAVSLSDGVELNITPKASGSFTSGEAELRVTTNNTTGYQVYMQTGDNTGSLKPANGMINAEIGPVVGEMTASNFSANLNTWGYAVAEGGANAEGLRYKAIPAASDPAIITTDKLTAEDSYTLGFATAVGADLPAGQYYNSVLVSVVANPIAVHTLSGITYMQEMSPYVCDYSDEEETKQLIDTRDGKSYWVAKLKDGNCWMTQNLALDLDTNEAGNAVAVSENGSKVELNSSNTDISDVWSEYTPSKTETTIPAKAEADYMSSRSWNFGKVVVTNPGAVISCDAIEAGDNITDCKWFEDVATWEASYSASRYNSINQADLTYDAHYLIGNYYQYNTATVGAGNDLYSPEEANIDANKNVDAASSICPKGWKLPASGRYYANDIGYPYGREDSFTNLLAAYGYPAGNAGTGWVNSGHPYTSINGTGKTPADYSPIYLMRSGIVYLGDLRDSGNDGRYWSSTVAFTSTDAFGLNIDSSNIIPAYISRRYIGLPARCLAR